jgi:hypothetical protein
LLEIGTKQHMNIDDNPDREPSPFARIDFSGFAFKLEPGCIYVIECTHSIPPSLMEALREWGDKNGIQLLILGPGSELKRACGIVQIGRLRIVYRDYGTLPARGLYWSDGGKPPVFRRIFYKWKTR